jgi:hypothetical protein
MAKPRPTNMFQYPQETELSPMRDKLLFIEALAASGELTGRELRVAILLTSFYSTTNGYAKPSMVRIATALGTDKSAVAKAIKKLAALGWFIVEHGNFKLGGKGHVNHYRPNPERVASATPFVDAPRAPQSPKGVKTSPKGVKTGHQRVSPATTDPNPYPNPRTDTGVLRTPSHSQNDDVAMDWLPPEGVIIARLKAIDRWLRKQNGCWSRRSLDTVKEYHAFVDNVFEAYPSHESDIGGMAYRLVSELGWILDQNGVP